jgi:hypothetical protein
MQVKCGIWNMAFLTPYLMPTRLSYDVTKAKWRWPQMAATPYVLQVDMFDRDPGIMSILCW